MLKDVKVIEYGNFISVPYCAKLLADLGAEVIKIEKPGTGDLARRAGPFLNNEVNLERSGLYLYLNTNKHSITLDVEKPTGKEIFERLVAKADIILEDTIPGKLSELGLSYPDLKKVNPSLVMTSITPFGQTGPYKHYKGSDLISWHMGLAGIITPRWVGTEAQEPLKIMHIASFIAGMTAAVATMCALRVNRKSGIGQQVDVSQFETMVSAVGPYPGYWSYEHRVTSRISKAEYAPMHFIKCKDGWVFIQGVEEHHWQRLVEIMGNPEWAKIDLFNTRYSRGEHWESLEPLLTNWAMNFTRAEVAEMGNSKGIPMGAVNSMAEVIGNDHLKFRKFFTEIEHPAISGLAYPGAPYKFSKTGWKIRKPAPTLGQDNKAIYTERLGFTDKELVRMSNSGII